jgi:hypothetical protein
METRSDVGTFTVISRWDRPGGVRSRAVEAFESWELARGYGLRLACQRGILEVKVIDPAGAVVATWCSTHNHGDNVWRQYESAARRLSSPAELAG